MIKSKIIRVRLHENPYGAFCRAYYASGAVRQWKLKEIVNCMNCTDNDIPETVREFVRQNKNNLKFREHGGINPYALWDFTENV